MGLVTEVMAPSDVALVAQFADMIQIGARNMNNVPLLYRVGTLGLPILLKRGMTATIGDALVAAESILALENDQVVICERGGRTFEPSLRNSLDIGAVPELQFRSDLPVIVDPSHGTGRTDLVEPIALASVAAGADGLIVEVHPDPAAALSDGFQALKVSHFSNFMRAVRDMAQAIGRQLWNG
jgi:3-deoxy-7-phosphoheptulonate synthase